MMWICQARIVYLCQSMSKRVDPAQGGRWSEVRSPQSEFSKYKIGVGAGGVVVRGGLI